MHILPLLRSALCPIVWDLFAFKTQYKQIGIDLLSRRSSAESFEFKKCGTLLQYMSEVCKVPNTLPKCVSMMYDHISLFLKSCNVYKSIIISGWT